MWVLLSALCLRIISNPIANACQKRLGETNSSLNVNLYISMLMCVACIYPALLVDWTLYPTEFWGYVFFAGLFCSLGTICLIKALYYGELSILGPLNSYKAIVGLVSAFVLLGETPSLIAILGVVLIVVGSLFLMVTPQTRVSAKNLKLSLLLRFAALIFTGCEASILKQIILMSSPQVSFILWCFCGLFFGVIFVPLFGRKFVLPKKREWLQYLLAAVCLSIMQFTTNIVFSKMEVGTALALFQLSAIVNLFLGYKIFHEGNMLRKILGTIVMIIGAVLILS